MIACVRVINAMIDRMVKMLDVAEVLATNHRHLNENQMALCRNHDLMVSSVQGLSDNQTAMLNNSQNILSTIDSLGNTIQQVVSNTEHNFSVL